MLFSRRKRAAAAASASAGNGIGPRGDAEANGRGDDAVVQTDPLASFPAVAPSSIDSPAAADTAPPPAKFEPMGFGISIEPVAPTPNDDPTAPQPVVSGPMASGPAGSEIPIEPVAPTPLDVGPPQAPGDEVGIADLDEFFAALRQVVDDSLARMPLESDRLEPQPLDEAELLEAELEADTELLDPAGPDGAPGGLAGRPEHAIEPAEERAGEMVLSTNGSQLSTELAPTTAELIAALEADRDRWRERAIVWRERAMGADLLVNSLNDHMAALRVNLEDLRMAIRVMSSAAPGSKSTPEARPAVAPPRDDEGTEPSEA